jgi:hypothetical protein
MTKPGSMPPQNRLWLDDAGQTEQAWPKPSHPDQQCAVTTPQPQMRCTPQGNIELMPEKQILDLKSAPRLERVGEKCPKQIEDRDH